jgi:hypothetical protein
VQAEDNHGYERETFVGHHDEDLLNAHSHRNLVRIARLLFPHPGLPSAPYARAVTALVTLASRTPALYLRIVNGLDELRDALGHSENTHLVEALVRLEETAFFDAVRAAIASELYDDREVWAYVGYPGPSFELGGYLTRGFNDLDWLPEPRVAENEDLLPEIGPLPVEPTR